MKILYLNIFEGLKEKERFNKIASFVKKENPDFVVLLEIDHWEEENSKIMNKFKEKTNINHFHFVYGNVGVFSKHPILETTLIKKGIAKIKINIKNNPLQIIVLHLDHKTEDNRLQEIDAILKNINLNEKTILIGDFNSLSILDEYNDERLLKELRKIKLEKFGTTKLRKEVHKTLLKFGLIDGIKLFSKKLEYSVPTEYKVDYTHLAKMRLDYIYITKNLKNNLKNAKVIRTKETNQLSDHFPIIAEFNF